jgi:hypothetical protein
MQKWMQPQNPDRKAALIRRLSDCLDGVSPARFDCRTPATHALDERRNRGAWRNRKLGSRQRPDMIAREAFDCHSVDTPSHLSSPSFACQLTE